MRKNYRSKTASELQNLITSHNKKNYASKSFTFCYLIAQACPTGVELCFRIHFFCLPIRRTVLEIGHIFKSGAKTKKKIAAIS